MEQLGTAAQSLSPSQLAFAQQMAAHPGLRSHTGAIFFYHEDQHEAMRWLVDDNGHVLDWTHFRETYHPRNSASFPNDPPSPPG